jgi:hypothetical protein
VEEDVPLPSQAAARVSWRNRRSAPRYLVWILVFPQTNSMEPLHARAYKKLNCTHSSSYCDRHLLAMDSHSPQVSHHRMYTLLIRLCSVWH